VSQLQPTKVGQCSQHQFQNLPPICVSCFVMLVARLHLVGVTHLLYFGGSVHIVTSGGQPSCCPGGVREVNGGALWTEPAYC